MIRLTIMLAIVNFIAGIFGITVPQKEEPWNQ